MSGVTSTAVQAALLPPRVITNGFSAGGASFAGLSTTDGCQVTQTGALSANVLATLVNATGPGIVDVCYLAALDITARTLRLQIIIDGVTAFDATTNSISAIGSGIIGIGGVGSKGADSTYPVLPQPKSFNSSLVVKVASSLTETNKSSLHISYHTS